MKFIKLITAFSTVMLLNLTLSSQLIAQQADEPAEATVVHGLHNWIHSTLDGERTFPFYRDIFGLELVRSPFGGAAPEGVPPPQIRPATEARSDPLIWNLTDSEGSRFRNVFMHTGNTPFGLELSEFFDIPRNETAPQPWDPGSSRLIFHVRDLDAVLASLEAANAPVVSVGGKALNTPGGHSIMIQDPDGYLIQVTQASASAIAQAPASDQIISTAIGLTVADTARSLEYYQGLLGFNVRETRTATRAELHLDGLESGQLSRTRLVLPGTRIIVMLYEYELPAEIPVVEPRIWRIQDVGSPQFQLQVSGLDALIQATQDAGYEFLSINAEPIQRAYGRFVFAIDPDGILVEYVGP